MSWCSWAPIILHDDKAKIDGLMVIFHVPCEFLRALTPSSAASTPHSLLDCSASSSYIPTNTPSPSSSALKEHMDHPASPGSNFQSSEETKEAKEACAHSLSDLIQALPSSKLSGLPWEVSTNQVSVSQAPRPAYMGNPPGIEVSRISQNYPSLLNALDFKPEAQASSLRNEFIQSVKDFVRSTSYRFLRKKDDEATFTTLIQDFLVAFGEKYWGSVHREHLKEV